MGHGKRTRAITIWRALASSALIVPIAGIASGSDAIDGRGGRPAVVDHRERPRERSVADERCGTGLVGIGTRPLLPPSSYRDLPIREDLKAGEYDPSYAYVFTLGIEDADPPRARTGNRGVWVRIEDIRGSTDIPGDALISALWIRRKDGAELMRHDFVDADVPARIWVRPVPDGELKLFTSSTPVQCIRQMIDDTLHAVGWGSRAHVQRESQGRFRSEADLRAFIRVEGAESPRDDP